MIFKEKYKTKGKELNSYFEISICRSENEKVLIYLKPYFNKEVYLNPVFKYTSTKYIFIFLCFNFKYSIIKY